MSEAFCEFMGVEGTVLFFSFGSVFDPGFDMAESGLFSLTMIFSIIGRENHVKGFHHEAKVIDGTINIVKSKSGKYFFINL